MSEAFDWDFRGIVDELPIGIVVHRELRILYANRVCLDVLGFERLGDPFGRDPLDLLMPDERERYTERSAAVARGEIIERLHVGEPSAPRRGCPGRMARRTPSKVVGYLVQFEGQPAIVTVIRYVTEQRSRRSSSSRHNTSDGRESRQRQT